MASPKALQRAAQAWCAPGTSGKVMDPDLAQAFAEILDQEWAKTEPNSKPQQEKPLVDRMVIDYE